ncbi:MAG: hypothetical protein GQ564_15915 [Bacteroidales bacterium]|nr:hypothetical protein [Bacteroidales bacterium]
MIKKVLGILIITTILFSCGKKTEKKEAVSEKEVAIITVDYLNPNIQSYIDKNIVVAGIVNHVCSHGGKRMFIMGEDPDMVIKITPNDNIGVFEKELEGSLVFVTGTVKELQINEDYVANLEKEVESGSDNEAIHDHSAGTHDEEAENEKKAQIEAMRTQISESENGYYSQYWIEADKFEVQEHDHSDCEGHDHENTEAEGHDQTEGEDHSH